MKATADGGLDLSEKGRNGASLDRRLFMQFLAFGNLSPRAVSKLAGELEDCSFTAVLYADANDYEGAGLLTLSENPDFFATELRQFLADSVLGWKHPSFRLKPEYTMFGRTYSLGYESDLEKTLISGPTEKVLDPGLGWAVWYPLRRAKSFETLAKDERRAVLAEHGRVGAQFGDAGYAKDIRLASHGLDKNDNDFVIGILGGDLHPLSALIERMRKTQQTSRHLESLGPFFVGRKLFSTRHIP